MQLRQRELIFSGPGISLQSEENVVPLVGSLEEAALSNAPEHGCIEGKVGAIAGRAQELSRALDGLVSCAIGPEDPFWRDYGPDFSTNVAAPWLLNMEIAAEAIRIHDPTALRVIENPTRAGWLRGREFVGEHVRCVKPCGVPLAIEVAGWRRLLRNSRTHECANQLWALRKHRQLLSEIRDSGPEPAAASVDVLFLVSGATYGAIVAQVESELTRRGVGTVGIIDYEGYARRAPALSHLHRNCWHWGSFLPNDERVGALRTLRRAQKRAVALAPAHTLDLSQYVAPEYAQGVAKGLHERLRVSLMSDWPHYSLRRSAAELIVNKLRPKVIVAFNPYHSYKIAAMVDVANREDIPTICLQHGIFGGASHEGLAALPYRHAMVYGEFAAERLRSLLPASSHVAVVGNCLYDRTNCSFGKHTRTNGSRPAILVAEQDNEGITEAGRPWWIASVCEAAVKLGAEVWLKLHPQERRFTQWAEVAARWPNVRVFRHGQRPLVELLRDADVMVTLYSTVVLEAVMVGTPAITVNLSGQKDIYPFAGEDGATGVYQHDDIKNALQNVLNQTSGAREGDIKRFLTRHIGPRDGASTRRICDIIEEYISCKNDR